MTSKKNGRKTSPFDNVLIKTKASRGIILHFISKQKYSIKRKTKKVNFRISFYVKSKRKLTVLSLEMNKMEEKTNGIKCQIKTL